MALPPVSTNLSLSRSIAQSREVLADLQRQLATGKKATSYGGVGLERTRLLSVRSELLQVQGYTHSISQADVRLDVMLQSATRIRELTSETRSDALAAGFERQTNNQTVVQVQSQARLDELLALLNTEAAGRYLFGGREGGAEPVAATKDLLEGVGTKAGFKQIVDERRQADMGADGRGRLVIPAAAAGVVNIAEDAAGSPFGFKLLGANSTLTGTTVTGPAGSPAAMDVTFSATLPQDGESIRVSLLLPDGTETDITLTARATATGAPGDFVIGADENDTADNFQAALTAAVENEAQVSLRAASLFAAADNFFDFDETTPPQRVDGPPFDSAVALRDATATDTVFWYQGELSSLPARESAIVKADDTSFISYGARADEDGFKTILKQLAVFSVETFEGDLDTASLRYGEVRSRMVDELGFASGAQSPDAILTELSTAKAALGRVSERHQSSATLLTDFVYDTENADINEVSAQILTLQARLEASLQVTAILKQISLVNFL